MSVTPNKIGTCPHGLPPGACPICNGMGGGVSATKKSDVPRNPGEMSYSECYAIGQMLKAQKLSQELNQKRLQIASFTQNMNNLILKVQDVLATIKAALPQPISNLFDKTVNKIIIPLLNMIKNMPQMIKDIQNFVKDIKNQIISVMEKLTAILGELKQFVDAKLKSAFKKLKKKIFSFLLFVDEEEEESDDTNAKIVELNEILKIKEIFRKSVEKTEKDDTDNE